MRRALLLLLLGAGIVHADADDLLQRAGAMLEKHVTTTGRFTQTATVAALSAPLVSAGSFYFDHERGISWHVERPISARFVFLPSSVDTTPSSATPMGWIGPLLNAALAGDLSALSRMFTVDGAVAADSWALTLVPHAAAVRHALARIDIAGGTTVARIQLREANGDDVTIVFSDIQYPPTLPADVQREFEQTP